MANKIDECQRYIASQYRTQLGQTLNNDLERLRDGKGPVWLRVSYEDLTTSALATEEHGGALLDPDIGVILFLIPFTTTMDIRAQVVRALALRSSLSSHRITQDKRDPLDPLGSWRIFVHWLVDSSDTSKWYADVVEIRQETGFSEEIVFDLIEISETGIEQSLKTHGLPRLLLTCRHVLKKTRSEEAVEWQSADHHVKQALERFDEDFRVADQKILAREVVRAIESFVPSESLAEALPSRPLPLKSIGIRQFRNLRDIQLPIGASDHSALVIHGPNGTGKSSITEAISIALFKSSWRYRQFSDIEREKDISARDRRADYLNGYIRPLSNPSAIPEVNIDRSEWRAIDLCDSTAVADIETDMNGTILTQERTSEFCLMNQSALAAQVVRDYSNLADFIEETVGNLVNQAQDGRVQLLRENGLTAQITKLETAYPKIAKRILKEHGPAIALPVVQWLEGIAAVVPGRAEALSIRWRNWDSDQAKDELAAEIAKSQSNSQRLQQTIQFWVEDYNRLIRDSAGVLSELQLRFGILGSEARNVLDDLDVWGLWLQKTQSTESKNAPDTQELTERQTALELEVSVLLGRGRDATRRLKHVQASEEFIQSSWVADHANECPTCSSDLTTRGGILNVVKELTELLTLQRQELLSQHQVVNEQLNEVRTKLAESGLEQCPVPIDQRDLIRDRFSVLMPEGTDFDAYIAVEGNRVALRATFEFGQRIPSLPDERHAETLGSEIAQEILRSFQQAEAAFKGPDDWKPVQAKLNDKLRDIVQQHLPNTLEKLWIELALSLTPAPWLLPARPQMATNVQRRQRTLSLRVNGSLARYILNQAEVHTLGLAWFFTRYLTHGRFQMPLIVLDDAAQEQDETTYRDFCRLLETFMRLHRASGVPLKVIAMLNQEARAVELAKATRGTLAILSWSKNQSDSLELIDVNGPEDLATSPEFLFA